MENSDKLLVLECEAMCYRKFWDFEPKDFAYEVAKRAGELGQEEPSENALLIAEQLILDFKKESLKQAGKRI